MNQSTETAGISRQHIQEILNGPDYFTCERGGTLPKKICIQRQTRGA